MFYKVAIAFGAGLIFGAAAAYYRVKSHFESKAQEEIEAVKRVYMNRKRASEKNNKDKSATNDVTKAYTYASYPDAVSVTQYNKMKNEEKIEDILVETEHPEDDKPSIYVIEEKDFIVPGEAYDNTTLTYYVEDSIIIDESDNEIFDEISWLDNRILDAFLESTDEVLYMRNDDIMMDFEIVKEYGHWDG